MKGVVDMINKWIDNRQAMTAEHYAINQLLNGDETSACLYFRTDRVPFTASNDVGRMSVVYTSTLTKRVVVLYSGATSEYTILIGDMPLNSKMFFGHKPHRIREWQVRNVRSAILSNIQGTDEYEQRWFSGRE